MGRTTTAAREGPRLSLLVRATDQDEESPFSPSAIRLWWLGLLTLHLVGGLFFGLIVFAYWNLPGMVVTTFLDFYHIGMNSKHYHAFAITHGVIAVLHGLAALRMVVGSIRHKKLFFRAKDQPRRQSQKQKQHRGKVRMAFDAVLARDGFFGVEGPYYDAILLLRETVETALQTSQGYRISLKVPRVWLNRFYITLLVANCWSTAFVHHMFRKSKAKMRLVALLADCLLDLVTSVGIPILLVIAYAHQFDFSTGNFNILRWFQDIWLANTMNEFDLILVQSWGDLTTRVIFAVSMLSNMNTMEGLLTTVTSKSYHAAPTQPRGASVAPFEKDSVESVQTRVNYVVVLTHRISTSKFVRAIFFCWGTTILLLHLLAQTNPKLPQCLVQVRPWGVSKPACSLVLMNCLTDGHDGVKDRVTAQWSLFDTNSVATLLVRNCPTFEVPPMLTSFHSMTTFKVYNTTILGWEAEAAFTHLNHPRMKGAMFMRVNFTNGELPPGMLSTNFPPSLFIIGFVVSNLHVLPDDLHTKWPRYSSLHLDTTQLTTFPETLWKISPSIIIMPNNPIETVPRELFQLEAMWYLDLAGTKLSALPEDVPLLTNPLLGINLGGTNISSFPSWIDPWVQRMASPYLPPLAAAGTPYCVEREQIFSGERTSFTAVPAGVVPASMSKLMDASAANRALLTSGVNCQPSFLYRYALAFEDTFQAL